MCQTYVDDRDSFKEPIQEFIIDDGTDKITVIPSRSVFKQLYPSNEYIETLFFFCFGVSFYENVYRVDAVSIDHPVVGHMRDFKMSFDTNY